MATRAEIENNIEATRDNISKKVDEISNIIHKKMDLKQKIRENPYLALSLALAAGFGLAAFSNPIGRSLLKIASRSAVAAAGAYFSKKGLDFVTHHLE